MGKYRICVHSRKRRRPVWAYLLDVAVENSWLLCHRSAVNADQPIYLLHDRLCAESKANLMDVLNKKAWTSVFQTKPPTTAWITSSWSILVNNNIRNRYCWYAVFFAETNHFRLSNLEYMLYFRRQSIPQCHPCIHMRRLVTKTLTFRVATIRFTSSFLMTFVYQIELNRVIIRIATHRQ